MKKLLLLLLLFTLAACNRTAPPEMNADAPSETRTSRLLSDETLEVRFEVDPATGQFATLSTSSLTTQAVDIDLQSSSKGLVDKGGTRYLYGTFDVTNTSNETLENLSFYALSTTRTLGGTALSNLLDANNRAVTGPSFARTIMPTHRMRNNSGTLVVKASEADFQGYSAAQVAQVQDQLGAGRNVLDYGFSARNARGTRPIAAGEKGSVTFAIKFPYEPSDSADYPFAFTLSFAIVDDAARQVTRSAEENPSSAADLCARAQGVGAGRVVVIGNEPSAPCDLVRLNDVKVANATDTLPAKYLLGEGPGAAIPNLQVSRAQLVYTQQNGGETAQTLTLRNFGSGALTVDGLDLSSTADFELDSATLPITLQPGQTSDVTLTFAPSSLGPKSARLAISSNDPDSPSRSVSLRGLSVKGTGGSNEPSLQWILDALAIDVDAGDPDPSDNGMPTSDLLGDEVEAQRFAKAGSGLVTVETLAVFGPDASNPVTTFGWYEAGDANSVTNLFDVTNSPKSNAQRLLPPVDGITSFDPGGKDFGVVSSWPFFGNRKVYSEDALNTFSGAIPHHVRVYPLPGEKDAYVVATEEHISGFDYQDVVVILRNVKPALLPEPVGCAPISPLLCNKIAVSLPYSLTFDGNEGKLEDKNGVGTGFTMVDAPSAPLSVPSNPQLPGYEPSKLSVANGSLTFTTTKGIQYVKPSTSTDTNSQVNALGVGVDASGKLRVETTLTDLDFPNNNQYQQAGIWFGLNEDNYAKLAVLNSGNGQAFIQLAREENAVLGNDDQVDTAPFDVAGKDVHLVLELDPFTRQASASYRVDGGAEILFATLELPAKLFSGKTVGGEEVSFAGIFTTHRRATRAMTFTFADFSVEEPKTLAPSGTLSLENRDWTSNQITDAARGHFDNWLAFNRITSDASNPRAHDTVTLRLKNDSNEVLKVSSLTLANNTNNVAGLPAYSLPNGETPSVENPLEISAKSFYDLEVAFTYPRESGRNEVVRAQLLVGSSDADTPTRTVQLGGSWQIRSEGGNEPNVAEIVRAFGFSTTILNPGEQLNNRGRIETIGEEVLSPFWERADEDEPVYVRQLAAYHSCCSNTATVYLQPDIDSGNTAKFFTHNGKDAQSFLPLLSGSNSKPAEGTKTPPNTLFGFKSDPEWSDPGRNNVKPDDCSAGRDTCGHHMRFWPVRDLNGTLVPNAYIMVMDYAGINYDFNDNVYFISNVKPAK